MPLRTGFVPVEASSGEEEQLLEESCVAVFAARSVVPTVFELPAAELWVFQMGDRFAAIATARLVATGSPAVAVATRLAALEPD